MVMRFRKSISVGKHSKINISKSGLSTSFGVRGAHVTVGNRGVTKSIGIPGTGISYVKQDKNSGQRVNPGSKKEVNSKPAPMPGKKICPYCDSQVNIDEESCPVCGYNFSSSQQVSNSIPQTVMQPSIPSPKKPKMGIGKKILIGIGVFFACFILLGVISVATYKKPSSTQSSTTSVATNQAAQSVPSKTISVSEKGQSTAAPAATSTPAPTQTPKPTEEAREWILNKATGKFHFPSCSVVGKIKDGNKETITATRSEMIAKGYSECDLCNS